MSPQALGQHGRKNVCFLQVGYGNENIRAVYVLLQEEILIRCVAVQHYGFIEFLRDRSSAVVVSLDEFDLVRILERLREPDTNVTTAGDNDSSDGLIKLTHLAQHSPNVLARSDKKNLIVFFYDSVPIRDDPLPISIDGDDATLGEKDAFLGEKEERSKKKKIKDMNAYLDNILSDDYDGGKDIDPEMTPEQDKAVEAEIAYAMDETKPAMTDAQKDLMASYQLMMHVGNAN